MFIKLTNAGTQETVVYIRADAVAMVGVDNDGDTLVVYDGRSEFVKEPPETVLWLIDRATGEGAVVK